ncbi:MAG: MarR family transcriptional regulator [Chloroflexales bacterium]|nr:MarR family transcriptional regulator [Chloroflexales bacterium]
MDTTRTSNLLGALALALADEVQQVTAQDTGHGATAPAALVSIGTYPGQTIDQLSGVLRLSHSGTVRLVDRLARDGLVERRAGTDGRTVALYLTTTGERAMHTLLAGRQHVLERALQGLTEAEQTQFTVLLEKALTNIVTSRSHADYICRLCDETVCPEAQCPVECAGKRHAAS